MGAGRFNGSFCLVLFALYGGGNVSILVALGVNGRGGGGVDCIYIMNSGRLLLFSMESRTQSCISGDVPGKRMLRS